MLNRIKILLFSATLFLAVSIYGQTADDTLKWSLGSRLVLGSGDYAPFLSAANQYDRHSIYPNNMSLWGNLHLDLDYSKFYDFGYGAEIDANLSEKENRVFPSEIYAESKLWLLVFTAGMKREQFNTTDGLLSSGGFLYSHNSRPLPALSCKSVGWVKVPFTFGFLECNGGMSHGWFSDNAVTKNTLLHYKYGGLRLGGKLPVKLTYVLNHAAQWGGVSEQFGESKVNLENFMRVFLARSGGSDAQIGDITNVLGNHIISKYYGIDVDLKDVSVSFYWQNLFEDTPMRPLGMAYNIEDGLWGLSFKMPRFKPLQRVVAEYFSTTDMSGPWHDLDGVIYGGNDNYFNNWAYPNGWSFYGMTMGNPWITSPKYNKDGNVEMENNMVRLYYLSGMGIIKNTSYKVTLAKSDNYGSCYNPYETKRSQFSWQIETDTPIKNNFSFQAGFSNDIGDMYGNNFAVLFGLTWNGSFN